jgi:predicted DNA-binding transcriptional regulator YafY
VNRTDRLHALAEELRRAGPAGRGAGWLADRFEVSVRTIKRDVAALQQTGLPVWAQAGPGGGYVIDEIATLPPVNLTPRQAVAVAVALAAQRDAPYHLDGQAALEKVMSVMGSVARERAERLGARIWVRGGSLAATSGISSVEQALTERRVVALTYRDGQGRQSRRRVEPHLIAHTGHHWYLVGWCIERQGPRWFRWDRIERADLTTEPVVDRDPAVFGTPPPDAYPVR